MPNKSKYAGGSAAALLAGLSLAALLLGGCHQSGNGAGGPGNAPPPNYGAQHAAAMAQYEQQHPRPGQGPQPRPGVPMGAPR